MHALGAMGGMDIAHIKERNQYRDYIDICQQLLVWYRVKFRSLSLAEYNLHTTRERVKGPCRRPLYNPGGPLFVPVLRTSLASRTVSGGRRYATSCLVPPQPDVLSV
ncbi:hypothetical protein TUM12370_29850 [Salmonella enterica subsp. enterica serovar Choleraesuis]|nr:hypothetical protein TUM12370_29850 [Salmonella enterica subsp. enterica serovar Choleraesuis]